MARQPAKPAHEQTFDEIIDRWFPLTYVLNNLNRGMGMADAYPFILPTPAPEKLRFVHDVISRASRWGRSTREARSSGGRERAAPAAGSIDREDAGLPSPCR